MNKQTIDEIALRVAQDCELYMVSNGDCTEEDFLEYTHALLAELSKGQEPVSKSGKHHAEIRKVLQYFNLPLDGVLEADLIYAIIDSCGPLFTQPLPRPDLVAENTALKEQASHAKYNYLGAMADCKQYEETIAQQAEAIRLKDEALVIAEIGSCTCCTKSYKTRYHASDCKFRLFGEALALQPSPEILQARDECVAEACCKVVDVHYDEMEPWLDSEMLRAEWKKYL